MDSNKVNTIGLGAVVYHQLARAAGGSQARVVSARSVSQPGRSIKTSEAAPWLCLDQASRQDIPSLFVSGPHILGASQKI